MYHSFRDIYRFQYDVLISTINRIRAEHDQKEETIALEVFDEMRHFYFGTRRFLDKFQEVEFHRSMETLDNLLAQNREQKE